MSKCTSREVKPAKEAEAIKSREDEVLNYFINRSTNTGAESLNSKMKVFRTQLIGVGDIPFFIFRLNKIFRITRKIANLPFTGTKWPVYDAKVGRF